MFEEISGDMIEINSFLNSSNYPNFQIVLFSLLKFNLIIVDDDGIFQGAGVKSEMLTAN